MDSVESPKGLSPRLRLQLVLLLLILWNVVALLAELSFGGPLLKVSDGKIGGLLAARGSVSGAVVVPLALYIYALVRGPMRYRGLVWIGVLEQSMIIVFGIYHVIADDITAEGAILPIAISGFLVFLLLTSMPRGQEVT